MKYGLIGISLMLMSFAAADLSADKLYTWTDAKGILHISKDPPPPTARTQNVMTYQPQTEVPIQKNEGAERRAVMPDEAGRKNNARPEAEKTGAKSEPQDDEDVYIGREGRVVRQAEEGQEMRGRPQEVRRDYRYRRR